MSDTKCVFCLDMLNTGGAEGLICGHVFHSECIQQHIRVHSTSLEAVKCPICKCSSLDLTQANTITLGDNVGVDPDAGASDVADAGASDVGPSDADDEVTLAMGDDVGVDHHGDDAVHLWFDPVDGLPQTASNVHGLSQAAVPTMPESQDAVPTMPQAAVPDMPESQAAATVHDLSQAAESPAAVPTMPESFARLFAAVPTMPQAAVPTMPESPAAVPTMPQAAVPDMPAQAAVSTQAAVLTMPQAAVPSMPESQAASNVHEQSQAAVCRRCGSPDGLQLANGDTADTCIQCQHVECYIQ